MQIKRFEAKNMTEALRLIKKELGSEAVILSARSMKRERGILGALKKTCVEVTAATDNSLYQPKPKKAFIVHGEEESCKNFSKKVEKLGIETYIPSMEESIVL